MAPNFYPIEARGLSHARGAHCLGVMPGCTRGPGAEPENKGHFVATLYSLILQNSLDCSAT